jgi:aminopeptidase N
MKKILLTFAIIFLVSSNLFSQEQFSKGSQYCAYRKALLHDLSDVINSPNSPKHSYDVLNYKMNFDLYDNFFSPYPKSYNANIIVKFRVDSTLNTINLNAVNSSLVVDSVSMAGVSLTHSSDILTVTLDRTYNIGEIAEVKIYFRHNNVSDNAFYASGGFVFTDCPPEGARKLYPCWDRPSDKATLDLTAKVPSTAKLGSNGLLYNTTVNGDTTYYNWVSNYPIATYLISMAGRVGYNLDIVYWHKISNPSDSIPIYFYWNTGESQANLNNIKTKIITMNDYYSELFGEYPFDKGGFATLNSQFPWAGMENQTLVSLCSNCWNENLVSHEHAHQWFGDMISPGTWADVWLNEGFATYCEALWYEHTSGYGSYKNTIIGDANSYFSGNPGWSIYDSSWAVNTPPGNILYNYAIIYAKGSCVLHMLRYTLGDSLFFHGLKSYATDTTNFKFKSAVTADFISELNQSTGHNLDWFFNEWVYGPNHPVYQNTYTFIDVGGGNWQVEFLAKQTQTNAGFFTMPIEIKVSFGSGDTTIRVLNDSNNQVFTFTFNSEPTNLQFDPNNDIVLKRGTTSVSVKDPSTIPLEFMLYQNYPNPFNPYTKIVYDISKTSNVTLKVFDILGKEIYKLENGLKETGRYSVDFDARGLSSGTYFYEIKAIERNSGKIFSEIKKMVVVK